MGYFDGNTVTAMWHYAQHFAMSDNAYTDTYGPSTPGALNVVAGQTNGMKIVATTKKPSTLAAVSYYIDDGQGGFTMINDVDPGYDVCSVPADQAMMPAKNIGDLLNAAGVTWGGFMGGFNLDTTNANGTTGCKRSTHSTVVGQDVVDYIPHHNWFQYYASTANPKHARPSSLAAIGYSFEHDGKTPRSGQPRIRSQDFYAAVKAGNFPAVSYIKLPAYQDGHAGYSDPLDEQAGTVDADQLPASSSRTGRSTAVIITWDDSDGWYDHAFAKATSPSFDAEADQLNGPGKCGTGTAAARCARQAGERPLRSRHAPAVLGDLALGQANYVSHAQISLASVVRFIEDNWLHGQRLGGGSFDATAGSIMDCSTSPAPAKRGALSRSDDGRAGRSPAGPGATDRQSRRPRLIGGACWRRLPLGVAAPLAAAPSESRRAHVLPGRKPASGAARASARRTAVGDGATGPAGLFRCRPVVVGTAVLRVVPQPGTRLWPAGRPAGDGWRPAIVAPGRACGAVADVSGASAEFQHRPRQRGKRERQPGATCRAQPGRGACRRPPQASRAAANLVPQGGLFWDGRADTLQDQALSPLLDPLEMDGGSVDTVAAKLRRALTRRGLCNCSAVRSVRSRASRSRGAVRRRALPDRGPELPLPIQQVRLLAGRQGAPSARPSCAAMRCSTIRPRPIAPAATSTSQAATACRRCSPITSSRRLGAPRNAALAVNGDPGFFDLGICGPYRQDMSGETQYCGLFMTPTLRNVATRHVFFHNGVYSSLKQVLDFYDFRDTQAQKIYPRGADGAVQKFNDVPPLYQANVDVTDPPFNRKSGDTPAMTEADENDIIAFLSTLVDGYREK